MYIQTMTTLNMTFTKEPVRAILITMIVLFTLLGLLPHVVVSGKIVQKRSFRSGKMLQIVNGTESLIREDKDGFVYCYSNLRSSGKNTPLSVVWTDPKGNRLLPYTRVDVEKDKMFSVQQDFYRPNSYLVFKKFDQSLEGTYTCNLVYMGKQLAMRSIKLKMFRPTFRVVVLPKCLIVRSGGTLLIPSPVIGTPEKPPRWGKIGGHMDLSTAIPLTFGLLIRNIRESAIYRAVAQLGGELTHKQDVTVSVITRDGRVKDVGVKPRVPSTAPTRCLRRPLSGNPLYSASVVIANDLIADMQMARCCNFSSERRNKKMTIQSKDTSKKDIVEIKQQMMK